MSHSISLESKEPKLWKIAIKCHDMCIYSHILKYFQPNEIESLLLLNEKNELTQIDNLLYSLSDETLY